MKRAGVLFLAGVPVVATAVYFVLPSGAADAPAAPTSVGAQSSRDDAKDRAEQDHEQKQDKDDEIVASLPPGLAAPAKTELAHRLVASAEHSTTDWRSTYGIIEDRDDHCGYTAGIIGFCTGTHDLLTLVEHYTESHPGNGLARYLPALRKVDGTDSHEGLDPGFTDAWKAESELPEFRAAQEEERDRVYFEPAVRLAKLDGLGTLGQFVYYDAMVFHGTGTDENGFYALRERVLEKAKTPAAGGSEKAYLDAFLDVRRATMLTRYPDRETSRVDTAQRRFLQAGNLDLATPLTWEMYGDSYTLS
ncbi:chitosanase [Streptomyces althioticus]|uniref:chitosanase n=1 Tax=Streptomyces althioticus group TaxID=2867194 RepID=UPI0017849588|nr:chitosanase [Streptomyces althioticus]WTB98458.1 chitosanase [Streptomyces althioticus]GGQ64309.1 chitosanase [Streptomyces griseorubens]